MSFSSPSRRVPVLVLCALAVGFAFQIHNSNSFSEETKVASPSSPTVPAPTPSRTAAFAAPATLLETETVDQDILTLAAADPVAFFERALRQYNTSVRDYTCVFHKQERMGGELGEEQSIDVMFRESPFSVRMKWVKNADKCNRILFVQDRWTKDGQQLAVIEPGAIARLFVPYVMRPIHGDDAKRSSRPAGDQLGFRSSMELTLKYVRLAKEKGVNFTFEYIGEGSFGGRDTLQFRRHLPYTGEGDLWPDRVLIVDVDKELQMPVSCQAYADDEQSKLLGRYQMTDVKLNVNLPDSTWTKSGMGL